ncbi:hypothetical protein ACJX0J_022345, partial [Zea mays]
SATFIDIAMLRGDYVPMEEITQVPKGLPPLFASLYHQIRMKEEDEASIIFNVEEVISRLDRTLWFSSFRQIINQCGKENVVPHTLILDEDGFWVHSASYRVTLHAHFMFLHC